MGAALAGTVLAITTYFAWSFRWKILWLGLTAEISLGLFLGFLGLAAVAALLGHMPS